MREFLRKINRVWGMIFRFIFIVMLGIVTYNWTDPKSIIDIPFARLTFRDILKNLFALWIIIACGVWFFHFPKQPENPEDRDAYEKWAYFSFVFVGICIIGIWLLMKY